MAKETDCDEQESDKGESKMDSVNSVESPINEATFSHNVKPNNLNLKLETSETNSGSTSNDNSPTVSERLVAITPPKTTVLGIRQAKKRLHAFSLMKQTLLPISPLLKKTPKQQKVSLVTAKTYDENGKETEETIVVKRPAKKGM